MNPIDFFVMPAGLASDCPVGELVGFSNAVLAPMLTLPGKYALIDIAEVSARLFSSVAGSPTVEEHHLFAGESIAVLLAHSGLLEPYTAQCGHCPREHEFVRVSDKGKAFLACVNGEADNAAYN